MSHETVSTNCYIIHHDKHSELTPSRLRGTSRAIIHSHWTDDLLALRGRGLLKDFQLIEIADDALDFLKAIAPEVESLYVRSFSGQDASAISSLCNLKRLTFASSRHCCDQIDFSRLRNLTECYIDHGSKGSNVSECSSLKSLTLCGGRELEDCSYFGEMKSLTCLSLSELKVNSLSGLENLGTLNELHLTNVTLDSPEGLAVLKNLKRLSLYRMRGIESLDFLRSLRNLESLMVGGFSKINDIEPLGALQDMLWLDIDSMGEVESLKPLLSLQKLERISFSESTKVLDGEIKCLLDLPKLREVYYKNRRHYDMKWQDFKSEMEKQGRWHPTTLS